MNKRRLIVEWPNIKKSKVECNIDLELRAANHTARVVGRTMVGLVAAKRHLRLNLRKYVRRRHFSPRCPISQSGLFSEAVSSE